MKKSGRRRGSFIYVCLIILLVLGGYSAWAITRPLPSIAPQTTTSLKATTAVSKLAWPPTTQAAVGVLGTDIMETHGDQTPRPTASTAKVITALVVLQKYPLKAGAQGPVVTLTERDVALYNQYLAKDGSVVPVIAGEQISEYQMLQALMLPSANNIADTMAQWAYGSLVDYAKAANNFVSKLGLTHTHIGKDASGLDPATVSTAGDLVKLGIAAMQNPVLPEIVGQASATGVPQTNGIKNVNFLLGKDNVIGIKTGNSDAAGGVFLSASKVSIGDTQTTIVTTLVGAQNLYSAVNGSLPLIRSAQINFSPHTLVRKGSIIGRYKLPWGSAVPAVASEDFSAITWNGSPVTVSVQLKPLNGPVPTGSKVGSLQTSHPVIGGIKQSNVVLSSGAAAPNLWWRLTHPHN